MDGNGELMSWSGWTGRRLPALAAANDARLGNNVDRYQQAVTALRTAWQAADDHARSTGSRQLSPIERRAARGRASTQLLTTALNTEAGDRERRSAYTKRPAMRNRSV